MIKYTCSTNFQENMEPSTSKKRGLLIEYERCIICQSEENLAVEKKTEKGIMSLKDADSNRKKRMT